MPIKNSILPDIKAGDPLSASWLNKLKNGNITVSAPLTISQQGGNYNIALDTLSKDWFLGKITSDAAGTSSDAVYYVRRERVVAAASDSVGFAMSDISDIFQPSDLNIRVVNIPELRDVYSDTTHLLPMNRPVQVFRTYDTAHPWKPKYAMWEHPRPCVNKLYDSASDLSDLSATIHDVTVNISDLADLSDLASDVSVVFATGHMYKDKASDLNPWVAFRLPLCVNSDYSTWSDLAGLSDSIPNATIVLGNTSDVADHASDVTALYVTGHMYKDKDSDLNPWMAFRLPLCTLSDYEKWAAISDKIDGATSFSDITGDITSSGYDDQFIVTGHMYQDANSDLNPWMIMDLKPGPSAYYISDLDAYGCSHVLSGIDLDSVGRVRKVGWKATDEVWSGPATWIGPEA